MEIAIQLGIILVLILVNAFFAAAEISVVSLSEIRVQTLANQGDRRARMIQRITRDSTQFLATIQVGITLAGFFTSATAASQLSQPMAMLLKPMLGKHSDSLSFVLVTIVIAFVSLVLGELVPKRIGLQYAEAIALNSVILITWIGRFTRPIVRFLTFVTNGFLRLLGSSVDDSQTIIQIEEIKALVEAARVGGTVGRQEQRIIHGAVELGHLTVRAIMVPRVQIQYITTQSSLEDALAIAKQYSHTRLPVCEGDIDRVVGLLHAKDLVGLNLHGNEPRPSIRELARPVRMVTETKLVADLLREMQQNRLHMAIVRDEFGGTAGLVTLEDVLEEIVGEIRDEFDAQEERKFQRVDAQTGIFHLRESLATVNNELNLTLPRDEAATLVGLFLEELERDPQPGDRITIGSTSLMVLADGKSVEVADAPAAEPAAEE